MQKYTHALNFEGEEYVSFQSKLERTISRKEDEHFDPELSFDVDKI